MRICLVGATHPCSNPRLVREADSLAEAGHEVRVVAPSFMTDLAARDRRLIANRRWTLETSDFQPIGRSGRRRSFLLRGRRRLAQSLFLAFPSQRLAEHSYTLALTELRKLAERESADWFIAHAHPALPVAARAARRWGAKLGFDCEDLLAQANSGSEAIAELIERQYLGACKYVSVPSETVGAELVRTYGVATPVVLYNFFPLSLVNGLAPPQARPVNSPIKTHWFGQTIGPGRGIEEAIEALAMVDGKAELHLRGNWAGGYAEPTIEMARRLNVKLVHHPTVDHDELIGTLAEFDVGLALERADDGNYSRTLTNKIGSYLLAGLAIAATDTPGQREILDKVPEAGRLYPAGDAKALAAILTRWINNREELAQAQRAAWDRSRESFCWEAEYAKFAAALGISDALPARAAVPGAA